MSNISGESSNPRNSSGVLSEGELNALVNGWAMMSQIRALQNDRRQCARQEWSVPASITPADEQGRPVGAAFNARLRDISEKGLGLVVDEKPQADFLNVEIRCNDRETLRITIKVVFARRTGKGYRVGGELVWPDGE